jgi:hypothetical protein
MHFLADAADVERLFLAIVIQLPEPGSGNDATLPALPRPTVACGGLDRQGRRESPKKRGESALETLCFQI